MAHNYKSLSKRMSEQVKLSQQQKKLIEEFKKRFSLQKHGEEVFMSKKTPFY